MILGETQLAAIVMDKCRELDLQDRYLNNQATRYLLQAGRIEQAMSTIALFTKHDGDSELILYELQCRSVNILTLSFCKPILLTAFQLV